MTFPANHRALRSPSAQTGLQADVQTGVRAAANRTPLDRAPANQDFFIERAGVRCAGAHLIVDLYGASRLDELEHIERTLRRCVEVAGATLLHVYLHPFEPNGGISGVAVLAESHISIHSWPEKQYAALDIFMCGKARPERCIEVLHEAFAPRRVVIEELLRGRSV
jgi:S-adenosylmethionine decarboxylase